MPGRHAHAHCEHKKLEFCGHCQVVWCHDCNAEFRPSSTWWGTTYTYSNQTLAGNQLCYKAMTNAESPVTLTQTHGHQHDGV